MLSETFIFLLYDIIFSKPHYLFVLLSLSKISWLTKQGFSHEYIEEVIASDALNEGQEEEIPKGANEDVEKELKAAQDAAKAAGEAAKNVFGKKLLQTGAIFKKKTLSF